MKTAFITGATSGLGAEFARRYAKEGYRLILTGRRTQRLSALKEELGTECLIITADVSDEAKCKELLDDIADEEIDVFINNAGFGTAGSFLETSLEKEISMVKVNDIAMHILFKVMLAKMHKQGHGTILNVASSAGLFPAGPYMSTYYASKAYVTSLTKGVAHELKEIGSSVYVACLCPGPVDTEFNANADVTFSLKGITAEKCVDECLKGMRKKKTVIIPMLRMKAATFGARLLPESFVIMMTAGQQKKKRQ